MTVEDLPGYLKTHWPPIRGQLLEGSYRPSPVLRKEIPKPGGVVRELGIPTVLDRLIQQALLQVLQSEWDPTFSRFSFGYRPRRSAHQAVASGATPGSSGVDEVIGSCAAVVYRVTWRGTRRSRHTARGGSARARL